MIHTIRQFELLPCPTLGTGLTRVGRTHLNHSFTGTFCLITEKVKKHSPCCVTDAFINATKVFFFHIVDRQVFNAYGVVFIHKLTRKLMCEVVSFVRYSFVNASDYLATFRSGFRGFLLSGKLSLSFLESSFFFTKEPRVFDLFTVRKRSEMFKPHIDSDRRIDRPLNRFMLNFAGKRYKPLSGRCAPDSTSFDCAFDRPVKFNLNPTDFGKPYNILEKFKSSLGICEAIVAKLTPETRVPRFVARFDSTEKGSESKVKSCRDVLQNLAKNAGQEWIFYFKCFQHIALVIARNAFLFIFPRCLSLFEKIVIQPSTRIKRSIKRCDLAIRRENSIFKSFSHYYTLIHFCIMSRKKSEVFA